MDLPSLSSIGKLFSSYEQFEIPRFQRKYEWSILDEIPTLWEDIKDASRTQKDHFIGSFVVMQDPNDSNKFMLIDGQQRMMTITILFRVLSEFVEIETKTIGKKETTIDWPKICKNINWIETYGRRRVIRTANDGSNYNTIMDTDEHYLGNRDNSDRCYQFFYRELKGMGEGEDEGLDVYDIINTLYDKVKVMPIKVDNEDACVLFESVNNTGKKLSPISMVRNYVMLKCMSIEDDNNSGEIQKDIDETYWTPFDKLGKEAELAEYLRVYLTMYHGRVSRNEIYSVAKGWIEDVFDDAVDLESAKQAANRLFTPLKNYYELYKVISGAKKFDDNRIEMVKIQNTIDIINSYGFKSHRSFLLRLLIDFDKKKDDEGKHQPEDYVTLREKTDLLESFIVRRALVQDLANNTVDVMFIELSQLEDPSYETIYNKMIKMEGRGVWPDDEMVKGSLRTKEFYAKGREKFCYNVLKRISADMNSNLTEMIVDAQPTCEHIFPQEPALWKDDYSIEEYQFLNDHVHFLGNMTPLTKPINSEANNEVYLIKLTNYANSNYKMTRDIEGTYGRKWGKEQFDNRQVQLMKKVISIWSRGKNNKNGMDIDPSMTKAQ